MAPDGHDGGKCGGGWSADTAGAVRLGAGTRSCGVNVVGAGGTSSIQSS